MNNFEEWYKLFERIWDVRMIENEHLKMICFLEMLSTINKVVNLWQFALKQAQELSRLNVERGLSEIRYPHLWAKKYLFRVYGEWRQQEEDAKSLLRIPTDSHKSYPSIPFISPSSSSLPVAQGKSLDEIRQSINKTFNLPPIK